MFSNWRIGSVNGLALAAYFIPAWTLVAFNIIVAPVHGLYERPSVAVALFISDHLQMSGMSTVRAAWLLALGRLTVVAFFAIFLALLSIPRVRKAGGADEALGIAILVGSLISFASMVMASKVGEIAALRLHATELLLLLGAAIVLVIERPARQPLEATAPLDRDEIGSGRNIGALPLGWGGGVSAMDTPDVERAPTRAFGATSPASGRG